MPIDYSKYPKNWKSEIRPQILKRAKNKCEFCNVENYKLILRGKYYEENVYQDELGYIYRESDSKIIGDDYVGEVCQSEKDKFIKVVLTIAHINHDINNNSPDNLKALCQKCHNNHDKNFRKSNRINNKLNLFSN